MFVTSCIKKWTEQTCIKIKLQNSWTSSLTDNDLLEFDQY